MMQRMDGATTRREWIRRSSGLFAGALVLPALWPAMALAEDGDQERWSHAFKFVGGKKQIEAVDEAIEAAVREMSRVIQGLARDRLRRSNKVPPLVYFKFEGKNVSVIHAGGRKATAPMDGTKIKWKSEFGDRIKISHKFSGDKLVQKLEGEGTRTNTYRLSEDGKKLTWKTHITAKRLPKDIDYRLSFRLVEGK